ncbi:MULTISPECIES: tetratricopeptide repeat-containing protein [unclassified Okeania]|uniref:tetratricopeptide repeat-containing protein n=1 Tax=unclassified Okeania TaxID=2634635 RepID=UPI0013CA6135|nr:MULTISPECIES: tetratricopeptide repeat-containing protein [unclassified Okeania]NES77604.1 tetratricopeptide repeat protein [Okeania sp. SIO1H4]NET15994.1 tetratricopeptide repeat protein [Okeania sp. SIO1H6]NET92691.1 tetratricopeptide repeat protein [Okeania sp. SIO1H2]
MRLEIWELPIKLFYKESLAIWKEKLGDNHPDVATSLNSLAGLYKSQGRYTEGEPLYKESLAIWKEKLGDNHPDVATSLNSLAGLYKSQGRYTEAEPLYLPPEPQSSSQTTQTLCKKTRPNGNATCTAIIWRY